VEAARAGEQGRGFAVVAAEVRALAQRSAEAAREIKALIGDAETRSKDGSRLAAEAGEAMTEIFAGVRRLDESMGQISAASNEQRAGLDQVNAAISQMDRMTQLNASMVGGLSSQAAALEREAASLARAVAEFRLHASQAPAAVEVVRETAPALPAARSTLLAAVA